ncbi:SDR family oxidoreductase [Candidatus Woesearchaeota archaeon]|nr:SDR family oxidoreductase [Candidatus Woesearchaeota archaeon]
MKLENKVAIITGGSGGIGSEIAKSFLEEGAQVIITYRSEEKVKKILRDLKEHYKSGRLDCVPLDITKEKEIKEVIEYVSERNTGIDILVNAAATQLPIGEFKDLKTEDILNGIQTNFTGTILFCKYALPYLTESKNGKIINFSGGGSLYPRPNFSIYGAMKTAIIRFSETLAEEVRRYNIDINVIAPGAINTNMVDEIIKAGNLAGSNELKKAKEIQQGNGNSPQVVADLAVFLASEESKGITGKLISAPYDNWRSLNKESSSLYTLRRIDGKNYFEGKND